MTSARPRSSIRCSSTASSRIGRVVRPSDAALDRAAELIEQAKKIAIYGGDGTRDARDEVLALSEKLKAPIGYAYRGKDVLEHDNPAAVGMTGLLGWGGAQARWPTAIC